MSAAKSGKAALTPSYCEIEGCTWEYKIQRHRIVPGRDGGKYKAMNVIALCPNHHWLSDNEILSTEELLEIVRLRYENGWLLSSEQSQNEQNASAGTGGDPEGGSSPAKEPSQGGGDGSPDAANGASSRLPCQ